jgi:hypothetical protein
MKFFYYASTFLFIVLNTATAKLIKKSDLNFDLNLDKVGVQVLLNKGKATTDGSFCNEDDQVIVQATLNAIFPVARRLNLREGGQYDRGLASCRENCKGFARGQCYVAYPKCTEYRRELLVNDVIKTISKEVNEVCRGLEKLVKGQIVKIITEVEGLSLPCLELAEKPVTLTCVLMD